MSISSSFWLVKLLLKNLNEIRIRNVISTMDNPLVYFPKELSFLT